MNRSHPLAAYFDPPQSPDELGRFGKYRVLRLLGEGGMGSVFRAEDPDLGRPVALKLMDPRLAVDENARARFLREARAGAKVPSKYAVAIYEVGERNGLAFLVMERLKGLSLEQWIGRNGVPPLPWVLRIGREVAKGLAAAHALGLIHRDIKPSNIWLDAPKGRARLIDFGLAADRMRGTRLTAENKSLGTPEYMAPEQIQDAAGVDERADLFSLGVVLYQLVTGQSPFRRASLHGTYAAILSVEVPPPIAVKPGLPVAVNNLIVQLISKDPQERPASASLVADSLRGIWDRQTSTVGTSTRNHLSQQPDPELPSHSPVDRELWSDYRPVLSAGSTDSVTPSDRVRESTGPSTPLPTRVPSQTEIPAAASPTRQPVEESGYRSADDPPVDQAARRPRPRWIMAGYLVAGALACGGLFGLAWVYRQFAATGDGGAPQTSPREVAERCDVEGDTWQVVENPEGFTAWMPGKPGGVFSPPDVSPKTWKIEHSQPNAGVYAVTVWRLHRMTFSSYGRPRWFDEGIDWQKAVGEMSQAYYDTSGGNSQMFRPSGPATVLFCNGYPGREVCFLPETADGKGGGVKRFFFAGDRAFLIFVGGRGLPTDSPRVQRFLSSFRITHRPQVQTP